jgi:hypothetical protein
VNGNEPDLAAWLGSLDGLLYTSFSMLEVTSPSIAPELSDYGPIPRLIVQSHVQSTGSDVERTVQVISLGRPEGRAHSSSHKARSRGGVLNVQKEMRLVSGQKCDEAWWGN